jgi:hypothetical protein
MIALRGNTFKVKDGVITVKVAATGEVLTVTQGNLNSGEARYINKGDWRCLTLRENWGTRSFAFHRREENHANS